ncbi:MAG TPA: sugar transferase [Puia sp.]|jgi:lipopolysaccharide/colanic/teichoic acid biosynthesis glycosyltransferase|nr:sugar transferase [Puia sp.]
MDVLFAPKTDREKGISTRYKFLYFAGAPAKLVDYQYSGFYYIGKNHGHIEKLVNTYVRGYASDGLENAKSELLRSAGQEKSILPEVIICEITFDVDAIRRFMDFLRMHPSFKSIPFVLEGTGVPAKDLWPFRQGVRPDEILLLERMDEKAIHRKVQFLRNIKGVREQGADPRLEERVAPSGALAIWTKRLFDIVVSALALLVLSPVFLLICILIRLESRGKVFYVSKRAGRGYKIFNFYKFRTMVADAEKRMNELTHLNQYITQSDGAVFFKINDDPRITRIGKFLRNTSLDELPQLVNVFLGHMSLVGNRPLPLYEAKELTTDDYAARFMAPAGITGLWQVKKRGNKDMSAEERISIDIMYAAKCSFATDLWIIANTPSALIQKANV